MRLRPAQRFPAAVMSVAAALVLGGCTSAAQSGGASTPAAAPPSSSHRVLASINVCAAIDASVLSLALGQRFDEGVSTPPTSSTMGQCDYAATEQRKAPIRHVYIAARPAAGYQALAEFRPTRAVPGLGTAAVFGPQVGLLVKLSGKAFFLQITAADATGDLVQAQAVAIARAALARL